MMTKLPVLVMNDLPTVETELLLKTDMVGWDIETSGLDWREDRIATCQIASRTEPVFIVRVNGGRHPKNLIRILEDRGVRKVFHHAMFDLRFMVHYWGAVPQNVACTKIAAKLLDPRNAHEHSLLTLLIRYLGVSLVKKEQTSDWFRDTLTDEQLEYARRDAAHLISLFEVFERRLRKDGLAGLAEGCFAHLPTRVQLDLLGYRDVFSYE